MYGMPSGQMGPLGFDPSMFMLSGYLLGMLAGLIAIALIVGLFTLPIFFIVLFVVEQGARLVAERTGTFAAKLVLIMFRGLRRSPLRTSLTYLALFVLTLVLSLIYAVLNFIGMVTTEKESNFKAIVTHKTIIPSQMPRGHFERFKEMCRKLPEGMRPEKGDDDVLAWSFLFGTTDPVTKRPDGNVFMFCLEPRKVTNMMDGLDDLTPTEKSQLDAAIEIMEKNPQAIVMSKSRLKKMNLKVGQRIKVTGLSHKDLVFDCDIIGELPEGKYEGVGFMNSAYLFAQLDAYQRDRVKNRTGDPHPMAEKCVNLIWVKLPNKEAFERLSAMVNDTGNFNTPQIKLETASSGIGTWLDSLKDIFFGMKYVMTPAMVAIMCLVIANAISIGVRERRTELAVLKVLGFQPRHVMLLVLGEAILVGLMAGEMSTFLAWYMIGGFKLQLAFFGAFFVPSIVLFYGPLLGAAVAIVGSLGPALTAKNVKVAEVFAKVA
ncbi:MAG TPA: ABC transporter permease [Gemmata sp.]|nr:ABC transporter permease [Gemmata sp.]